MRANLRSLLSALVLTGSALAGPAGETQPEHAAVTDPAVGIDEKLGSTIALDLTLRDEANQPVTLRRLIDKPTLLTLNYFRCSNICTPQLNGLVAALNQTQAEPGKAFQVITVSFDERDTPEIAAQKRINYLRTLTRPFPPEAWRFLTGDAAVTRALADSVGFRFKQQGKDFSHPASIMVLSPKGELTRYLYGVSFLPADLQMAVAEAERGQARPTIPKWLSICYSVDPEGRRQAFSITRLAAILTLLGAGTFVAVLLFRGRRGQGRSGGAPRR